MAKCILILEEQERVATPLQAALRAAGFVVYWERIGSAALRRAADVAIDGAILDIGLEDCSAVDVARTLREMYATIPLVICTSFDSKVLIPVADEIGASLMEKPVEEATLLELLH